MPGVNLPHHACINLAPLVAGVAQRFMLFLPGGMPFITETSKSPYTVSASVRGIGVAVITRTSGS